MSVFSNRLSISPERPVDPVTLSILELIDRLLRNTKISTTMNVYGNALMTAKREANSKLVKMALRSA